MFAAGKRQPAASIDTFVRFQAGFLSFEDFHRVLWIFISFYRYPWISMISIDFHGFGHGCLPPVREPAALIETFARFQAGSLSVEDFHRIL